MPGIIEQTGIVEELSAEDQAALAAEEQGTVPEPVTETETETVDGQPQAQIQTNTEAAAAATAQAAEKDGKKKPPAAIPYDRFKEELEARKTAETAATAAQARATELEVKWARLEERQRLAQEADAHMQAAAAQARTASQRPDPAIDPMGAELFDRDQRIAQQEARLAQLEQGQTQTAQTVEQQRQLDEYRNRLNYDVQTYRVQHADYDDRANAAQQKFKDFLTGVGATQQESEIVVAQVANFIAQKAIQNGKSAADAFYQFAETVVPRTVAVPGQQQARTSQAQETLRQVQKGQQFQGMSRVPAEEGNSDGRLPTAAELAEMSEDDFMAQALSPDPKVRARIMKAFGTAEGVEGRF